MIELLATMSLQVIPASTSQDLIFDILSYIFGYVSSDDPLNGPMTVFHVCRHWREVAQESPLIWSDIVIRLNSEPATSSSKLEHLSSSVASDYFKRSHDRPIEVTIDATRLFESGETELLLKHSHRIRYLHIKTNDAPLANRIWIQMDMPMPKLEAFETTASSISLISLSTNRNATIDENVLFLETAVGGLGP